MAQSESIALGYPSTLVLKMGLTRKSKRLLELLLLSGLDALEVTTRPKSLIYGTVGWSSDRNASRHLKALSEKGLISLSDERTSGSWVVQITEGGKYATQEEIDPETSWAQDWDGKWRTLFFDLPQDAASERKRLNAWLRKYRFGHLQGSLWITHRSYNDWTNEIENRSIDPLAVLFQVSAPAGRLTSEQYASKAWPFEEINRHYDDHISFLKNNPIPNPDQPLQWFKTESRLWSSAYDIDPFLPNSLLPPNYRGKEAFKMRKQAFTNWSSKIVFESP